jgi:hypothetical protein
VFDPRCPRCRDAGSEQYYTFDGGDGRLWHFDVGLAAQIALTHPETLGLVAVADLLAHAGRNEVDPAHVSHVDETIPLLAVTVEQGGGPVAVLIDGNYRLRKLAALGVADAQVYLLDREQTEAVIALGPDGPRSDLGHLIQRGLRDAGNETLNKERSE